MDVTLLGRPCEGIQTVIALPASRPDHSYLMACPPSPLGCDQGRRKQGSLLSLWDHPVLSKRRTFLGTMTGTSRSWTINFQPRGTGHDRRAIRLGSPCPSWFSVISELEISFLVRFRIWALLRRAGTPGHPWPVGGMSGLPR
jgi:hypothetical protein